eukprot:5879047-Pleurochrysis_carterae.AAC.1
MCLLLSVFPDPLSPLTTIACGRKDAQANTHERRGWQAWVRWDTKGHEHCQAQVWLRCNTTTAPERWRAAFCPT